MLVEWLLNFAAVSSVIAVSQDIGSGKQAYQITTVKIPGISTSYFQPGLAVDGKTECHTWFSHTHNHQMPWWAVDLGDYYIIDFVQVIPRGWLNGYSGNFTILVGSTRYSLRVRSTFTECASRYGYQMKWLRCSQAPVVGRDVVVQREKDSDVRNLCLCEVVVLGRKACPAGKRGRSCRIDCSDGKWGPHCAFSCSPGCRNTCDKVTGACQCEDEWFGDLCDRTCSNNCITPGVCKGPDGYCSCKPGYEPPTCRFVCPRGWYGQNCTKECSTGCQSGDCEHTDGTCVCLNTRYRQNCTGNCGRGCLTLPCDKDNGECTCKPGWQPPLCKERCGAGFYGQYCNKTCPGCNGTCFPEDGKCVSCRPGWYGYQCDKRCETGCKDGRCRKDNGHCTCRPGYRGQKCDQVCEEGFYGQNCRHRCGCLILSTCNHVNGTCTDGKCQPGKKGGTCDTECDEGFYGENCRHRCGCLTVSACNHITGHCGDGKCQPGKKGKTCDIACEDGTYGSNCEGQCYCKHGPTDCSKIDGKCRSGQCVEGRQGEACQGLSASAKSPERSILVYILPSIFGGAILTLAVGAAMYCIIRRRQGNRRTEKDDQTSVSNQEPIQMVPVQNEQTTYEGIYTVAPEHVYTSLEGPSPEYEFIE